MRHGGVNTFAESAIQIMLDVSGLDLPFTSSARVAADSRPLSDQTSFLDLGFPHRCGTALAFSRHCLLGQRGEQIFKQRTLAVAQAWECTQRGIYAGELKRAHLPSVHTNERMPERCAVLVCCVSRAVALLSVNCRTVCIRL